MRYEYPGRRSISDYARQKIDSWVKSTVDKMPFAFCQNDVVVTREHAKMLLWGKHLPLDGGEFSTYCICGIKHAPMLRL
jgi:hypothetical protein